MPIALVGCSRRLQGAASRKGARSAGTDEYPPTFALIDTDQDGFISTGEFKKLLDVLGGGSVADETAAAMFAQMDGDGDGKVDLDELSAYLQASRS